jgi:hypothetical protein
MHRRESENYARFRAGRLIFALAALQNPDDYVRKELLCLQGTRGVDAYRALRPERRRKAAAARRKPLRDMPWYVEHHLPRAQERLAGELGALVQHPQLLIEVLDLKGAYAMAHHL